MRRSTIGILALVLLFLWFVTYFFGPGGMAAQGFAGGCVRVGLALAALWLAWPQIAALGKQVPAWLLGWIGLGRSKPPDGQQSGQQTQQEGSAGPLPEPVREKRPRRRSQR